VFKERPGATRVVFHLPARRASRCRWRSAGGVAYDAELLSEVRRRLGDGLVRLEVSRGTDSLTSRSGASGRADCEAFLSAPHGSVRLTGERSTSHSESAG